MCIQLCLVQSSSPSPILPLSLPLSCALVRCPSSLLLPPAPSLDSPGQGGATAVAPSPRKPISPDPMGKPPASPASREMTSAADTECVFLIGAYQRYQRCHDRHRHRISTVSTVPMPVMTLSFTPQSALGHLVRGAAVDGRAALACTCAYLHHPNRMGGR